jgi:hypothetical protein
MSMNQMRPAQQPTAFLAGDLPQIDDDGVRVPATVNDKEWQCLSQQYGLAEPIREQLDFIIAAFRLERGAALALRRSVKLYLKVHSAGEKLRSLMNSDQAAPIRDILDVTPDGRVLLRSYPKPGRWDETLDCLGQLIDDCNRMASHRRSKRGPLDAGLETFVYRMVQLIEGATGKSIERSKNRSTAGTPIYARLIDEVYRIAMKDPAAKCGSIDDQLKALINDRNVGLYGPID